MPDNAEPGFTITPRSLGFITSLLVFSGLLFTGISTVNGYQYRMERIEQDNKVLATDITTVSNKLNDLNTQLVSLTITLNKVEERLNARLEKK